MNISKKYTIISVIVILAVLIVGFSLYKASRADSYSVVYMTTGEIYIGKLMTFPDLRLADGYILQATKDAKDPTKSSFQLQPVNQSLWAPQILHLNRENVIFYGPLMDTSAIAKRLIETEQAK